MNSDSSSQHNPYAAPLADTPMAGEAVRHFGLQEAVCLEGTLTVDDLVQAVRALQGNMRWLRPVIVVAILFAVCSPIWTSAGPQPVRLLAWIALSCLYLWYWLYWYPRRYRRRLREGLGEGRGERYVVSEQGLEFTASQCREEFRWERFSGFREIRNLLLLRMYDADDFLVIPRRYCGSDSDWSTVLGLLAYKLPLWEGAKQPPRPPVSQPTAAEADVIEEPADSSEPETILASGQATPGELRRAGRLVRPWWLLRKAFGFVLTGLAIWLLIGWESRLVAGDLVTLAIVLSIIAARLASPLWQQHTAWRKMQAPFEWQTWRINAEGIRLSTPTSRHSIAWSVFRRVIVRRSCMILVTAGRGFFLLPRRYFRSDADWEQLLRIVKAQRAK